MYQFYAGDSKIAVISFQVNPPDLSCHVEIFLGPDINTKIVTSGLIPFISTGNQQQIDVPLIMPQVDGTYNVYICVYSNEQLFLSYIATENIVIQPVGVKVESAHIDIFSLNGILFSEVGQDNIPMLCDACGGVGSYEILQYPYGYVTVTCHKCGGSGIMHINGKWARLSEPIVAASPVGAINIKGRNKTIKFDSDGGADRIAAIATFYLGPPYSTPGFRGYAPSSNIPWVDMGGYKLAHPPFDFSVTPNSAVSAGQWMPGLWSFRIRVEFVDRYNAAYASVIFYVINGFQCTGSGSVSV